MHNCMYVSIVVIYLYINCVLILILFYLFYNILVVFLTEKLRKKNIIKICFILAHIPIIMLFTTK